MAAAFEHLLPNPAPNRDTGFGSLLAVRTVMKPRYCVRGKFVPNCLSLKAWFPVIMTMHSRAAINCELSDIALHP